MAKTTGRREWLSMVARGAAAATVGVLGQPRSARSDGDCGHPCIKHIVVLMMENRSFDHMLGLLMNEIPDLRGVRVGDWSNVDDKGNVHTLTGPTNPNRAFAHFGTSFGRVDNGPVWFMMVDRRREPGIYGRLRDRGRTAKIYYYSQQSGTIAMTFLPSYYFGLYRDFVNDCRNNALPDYAFIEPPYVDQDDGTMSADHHPDNFVLAGDQFIRNVYEAIRSSDEVWRSTLFLIVWDEHGGIFDHVSPPTLPYGDSFRSAVGFNFDRLGVRVGAIVVSPYVTPSVSHALFEHASGPATVTQQFIGPPGKQPPYRREHGASTLQQLLIDMSPRMERPDFGRPTRRSDSGYDRVSPVSLSASHPPDRPTLGPTR